MKEHDVIIIGAGLAGLRAAFEGITAGLSTAVITKVHPLRSHSCAAQGGVNAAINPKVFNLTFVDYWDCWWIYQKWKVTHLRIFMFLKL